MQGSETGLLKPLRLWGLFGVFLLCLGGDVSGQGTVKGFVTAEKDGAPVLFAAVVLEGTTFGVSTDTEGYYSLSKVPAGTYTSVSYTHLTLPTIYSV